MKRPSHGTVVAYLALVLALSGTGYAATRRGGATESSGIKVRCTARRGRRKVGCQVVGGSAQNGTNGSSGKDGKPGQKGEAGPSGPSGPTTITQQPGYSIRSVTTSPSESNILTPSSKYSDSTVNDTFQGFEFKGTPGSAYTAHALLQTPLLSPGELSGSAQHLSSVSFCHLGDRIIGNGNTDPTVAFTHATVYALDEPDAPGAALPPYTTTKLIDTPLSIADGSGGCTTVSAPSPAAIPATAFLVFRIEVTYTQVSTATGGGFIELGRVSTTYTP